LRSRDTIIVESGGVDPIKRFSHYPLWVIVPILLESILGAIFDILAASLPKDLKASDIENLIQIRPRPYRQTGIKYITLSIIQSVVGNNKQEDQLSLTTRAMRKTARLLFVAYSVLTVA